MKSIIVFLINTMSVLNIICDKNVMISKLNSVLSSGPKNFRYKVDHGFNYITSHTISNEVENHDKKLRDETVFNDTKPFTPSIDVLNISKHFITTKTTHTVTTASTISIKENIERTQTNKPKATFSYLRNHSSFDPVSFLSSKLYNRDNETSSTNLDNSTNMDLTNQFQPYSTTTLETENSLFSEEYETTKSKIKLPRRAKTRSDMKGFLKWEKYVPNILRDKAGNKIKIKDISERQPKPINTNASLILFKYPQIRDRWWWEMGEHEMHYLFWHCHYWMAFWNKHPPPIVNASLISQHFVMNGEENLSDYSQNEKEAFYYKYCKWLLREEKVRDTQSNIADEEIYKNHAKYTVRPKREQIMRRQLRGPIARCYYCNQNNNPADKEGKGGLPNNRICSRAFSEKQYLKFQKVLKVECYHTSHWSWKNKIYMYEIKHGELGKYGVTYVYGYFYPNECATVLTDVGELYTGRSCRWRDLDNNTAIYGDFEYRWGRTHLSHVIDILEVMAHGKQNGCFSTPYSVFLPLAKARIGLYVRVRYCVCNGDYCNSSVRITHIKGLMFSLVLIKMAFV